MGIKPFNKGLSDLGNNIYCYLQPDGGWGWSNAGLIADGDESLIVDTLFDEDLTLEMLDSMKSAEPKGMKNIRALINSHSNGDHCNGNNCVDTDEVISSEATLEEMSHESPEMMAALLKQAPEMGTLGKYFLECFGSFNFEGVTKRLPNTTFTGETQRQVGDKIVELIEVGPAHTNGDILVHVPSDKVVFTGDILFIEGHPILWAGPVKNWINACDRIISMEVDFVVPGHGPVTDNRGVKAVRDYLAYIDTESRERFESGMSALEAAKEIDLDLFSTWGDGERIAVNVNSLYREYKGEEKREEITLLFQQMAELSGIDE
ncbi:MAG TPA: MBL fold metallo-hydrolase [Gammaproteobacteria bacterium]|nr:MBL fold metallo-hydrolase [Gammaproteobacteria bacterium]HIG49883.1 MBL fold metallo-hydrolase [Gammaproteobacteria bacterium]HIN74290.1 MBL fold metallo-hydrolase [Gammaproteobacteria bacterium]HIO04515.1 MBL fold metallo-hydrolase [Gammaproteobacteria bacterium]